MKLIKGIEIEGLFGMEGSLSWELRTGVNVLSGGNGCGKSTLLHSVGELLTHGLLSPPLGSLSRTVKILFEDSTTLSSTTPFDPTPYASGVITNFLEPITQPHISQQSPNYDLFCNIVDSLFLPSGKKIVRQGGEELFFELQWMDIRLPLSVLSSGERQIIHLLECAAMSHQGDMMILDEPEISLHFDWQKRVLEDILSLSPSL
ncbi:MAG: AAA family ATPase, partial [Mucinivorans sp.]